MLQTLEKWKKAVVTLADGEKIEFDNADDAAETAEA